MAYRPDIINLSNYNDYKIVDDARRIKGCVNRERVASRIMANGKEVVLYLQTNKQLT